MIHQVEIRILWIVLAVYFINKLLFNYSLYSMSVLFPFSVFDIDFRDSFEWKFNSCSAKSRISYHKVQTLTKDIANLLESLEDETDFSMGISFISSYKEWKDNKELLYPLYVNDAIIVNRESDPIVITQFIMESLDKKGYFISDWLLNYEKINKMDPVILTVTVAIKIEI